MSITFERLKALNNDFCANQFTKNLNPEDARFLMGAVAYRSFFGYYKGDYYSWNADFSITFTRADETKSRFAFFVGTNGLVEHETETGIYGTFRVGFSEDTNVLASGQRTSCSSDLEDSSDRDDVDIDVLGEENLGMHITETTSSIVNYIAINIGSDSWVCGENDFHLRTNVPLFDTEAHAIEYVNSGSMVGCLNNQEAPEYESSTTGNRYYYNMILWRTPTGSYEDASIISRKRFYLYLKDSERIVGYCNNPAPNNAKFVCNAAGSSQQLTAREIQVSTDNGATWESTTVGNINSYGWSFTNANNVITDGEYYYYTDVSTNITMRGTKGAALKVSMQEEAEDNALNTRRNRTGTEVDTQNASDVNRQSAMSNAWVTDFAGSAAVSGVLYSTSESTQEAIKTYYALLGQNPIDAICSMWYCPISITDMATSVTSRMKFGTVEVEHDMLVVQQSKIQTLCNVFINETFGNFLDYTNIKTYLYLPFVGLTDIDFAQIINHTLRIDATIDMYNATIKYWIFGDEKLIGDRTANVGCQQPVTGNDQVGRARESADAINNVINDVSEAIMNPQQSIPMVAGKVAQVGLGTHPAAMAFGNKGALMKSGTSSSGVSCSDILYPFLLFDTQGAIIPDNLYETYGMPCNYIGKLAECSGWTECYDVQLVGAMLPEEHDELIEMLSSGVIL